jgi:hypothetical protein
MEVIANILPIDLYLKQKAALFFVKNNIKNTLTNEYFDLDISLVQRPIDVFNLKHYALRKQMMISNRMSLNHVVINAEKNNEGTGGSLIAIIDDKEVVKSIKLSQHCSRFQALLVTTYEAVILIKELMENKTNEEITLFIDKSCTTALKDTSSLNLIIYSIHELLYEMEGRINVNLSHDMSDITVSDKQQKCKELASSAIKSLTSLTFELIPIKFVKQTINALVLEQWDKRWQDSSTGRLTKKYFVNIKHRNEISSNLKHDFKLTQILTNHGNMNSYLKRFSLKDTEECLECIGEEDDSDYRVFNCKRFDIHRNALKEKMLLKNIYWSPNPSTFMNTSILKDFTEFCHQIIT